MSHEPITLYKMDLRVAMAPNGYELSPRGRLAWLHRLLWRALLKMGAIRTSMKETVEVIRLPLSGDSILERIFNAREGMLKTYRKPREILIGPQTLAELISCPDLRDSYQAFSFTGRAGFDRMLYNLPIHVEPQMEGVLIR